MKSVYAIETGRRQKPKKQAKLKSVAAANIAKRYKELIRLRAIVYEVEAKPHVR
jgi:hypothetical protein